MNPAVGRHPMWVNAMSLRLFGPSQGEIDEIAHDLIVRHGLDAYDEAVHLSEAVRLLPRSVRQRKMYRLAAVQIEQSFETARKRLGQKLAGETRTALTTAAIPSPASR
ncbi:hypothetical protein [Methylocapsa sp. S129]|uniref:hypothetical protein n=1 Tax=Methylocapsa sp. S129 TaxID=1641869 RepID=UPI00131B55FA|nr:hypothetical protein [Methylocapsa sp. S129]